MSEYEQRDTELLGEHYFRHLDAMTREGLHAKSAIAAELAYRDARIAELERQLCAQPPADYPSWEDWLASYGYQIGYASTIDCWILHKPSGNSMQYDDYPSALAAAKKEAGVCSKCSNKLNAMGRCPACMVEFVREVSQA